MRASKCEQKCPPVPNPRLLLIFHHFSVLKFTLSLSLSLSHTHTHTRTHTHTHIYIYMYTIPLQTHTHTHTYTHTHIYIYVHNPSTDTHAHTHTHIYICTQSLYRQYIDVCIFYQTLPHVSPIKFYAFWRAAIPRNTRRVISIVLWQTGLAADVMYRCHWVLFMLPFTTTN